MVVTREQSRVARVALERLEQRGVVVFTGFVYVMADEGQFAAHTIQKAWRQSLTNRDPAV